MSKKLSILLLLCVSGNAVHGQTFTPVPYTFIPGTIANASQMMANYQSIINNGNAVSADLASRIASKTLLPSGTVAFFNNTVCPTGWTLYGLANDRFIRGLDLGAGRDSGNTLFQQAAERLQTHNHSVTTGGRTGTVAGANANFGSAFSTPVSANFGTTFSQPVSGSAGGGVIPPAVKLLVCRKN